MPEGQGMLRQVALGATKLSHAWLLKSSSQAATVLGWMVVAGKGAAGLLSPFYDPPATVTEWAMTN